MFPIEQAEQTWLISNHFGVEHGPIGIVSFSGIYDKESKKECIFIITINKMLLTFFSMNVPLVNTSVVLNFYTFIIL